MNEWNFNNRNLDVSSAFNSVQRISAQFDAQYATIDQMNWEKARRDARIVAGAEASVVQKELMEEQLSELKSQNDIFAEQLKAEQEQREVLEEHLKVISEQNGLLSANYNKIEKCITPKKI